MNAYLLNHPNDLNLITKYNQDKNIIYARNYFTFLMCKNKKIKEIPYKKLLNAREINSIKNFRSNWFRNKNDEDVINYCGISIGNAITGNLTRDFVNDLRNFEILSFLSKKYKTIYISSQDSNSFKRVAKIFKNKIKFYTSKNITNKLLLNDLEPEVTHFVPKVHYLSKYARIIQRPFIKLLKNQKIINIPDVTSKDVFKKREDTLNLNGFNPWSSFYYNKNNFFYKKSEKIFPKKLSSKINLKFLENSSQKAGISCPKDLLKIFLVNLKKKYQYNRIFYVHSCSIYMELYNFYKPKIVILPSNLPYHNSIACDVANKFKIKTAMCVDGSFHKYTDEIFYDKHKKNFVFDKIFTFGKSTLNMFQKEGVKKNKLILSEAPILDAYDNKKKSGNKKYFDAIIIDYTASSNIISPESHWGHQGKFVIDIIKVLLSLGYKKVAIKFKEGHYNQEDYRNFILQILKKNNIKNKIEFIYGQLSEHINKANLIVGYNGTALIESIFNNKKYYIYEPVANGLSKVEMKTSFVSFKNMARTPKQLKNNIIKKNCPFLFNKNYIIKGPKINDIELF